MAEMKQYVHTDAQGVMRVGQSDVMLDGVVYAFKEGASPEAITRSYPTLGLEEVYGAITYYLAHEDEVQAYLKRQEELWANRRMEQDRNPPAVVQRLKSAKAARAREGAA